MFYFDCQVWGTPLNLLRNECLTHLFLVPSLPLGDSALSKENSYLKEMYILEGKAANQWSLNI